MGDQQPQDRPADDRPAGPHPPPARPDETAPGDRPPATLVAEDRQLRDSIAALSRLSTAYPLTETLTRVAVLAVRAIPGAEGAGLTLLENSRADTIVATDPFVTTVDEIQYSLGQGPCITAAADGVTVISGSLGADPRWRKFGSQVARLGVHSAISIPLITHDGVVGAMNVYARGKHVFDDRSAVLGGLFAVPAAIAVQNAHILVETERLAQRLQRALGERGIVDQAIGIMISRTGGTSVEALERLRALSQREHQKITVIAEQIVDEAVRRARARHTNQD